MFLRHARVQRGFEVKAPSIGMEQGQLKMWGKMLKMEKKTRKMSQF